MDLSKYGLILNHLAAEHSEHSPDGATSMGLTNDTLIQIRNLACLNEHFAVWLVCETSQPHDLFGRNVIGKRGKQSLDLCISIHKKIGYSERLPQGN